MLPFWKKTGNKIKSPVSSPKKQINGSVESVDDRISDREPCFLGPLSKVVCRRKDIKLFGDKSRLNLKFHDCLNDKLALSYFTQYLEGRNYLSLFHVWLQLDQILEGTHDGACGERTTADATSTKEEVGVRPVVARARSNDLPSDGLSKIGTFRPHSFGEPNERLSVAVGVKIWHRYLADDAPQHIRVPDDIRSAIQLCLSRHDLNDYPFQRLRDHIFQVLEKDLWNDFMKSEWHCKYQVKILTSGTVKLADVLYHNGALSAFIEFLEQEGCQHIIEFWLAAVNFETHVRENPDCDPLEAQNDAMIIYDKYLSLQATCPLGIDDKTRCEVEQGICVDTLRPEADCFSPALCVLLTYLTDSWLRPFLASQYYVNLLTDLMRSSRANSSPASSVTDVSIDTSIKHDPDSIWKRRRQHTGLSIGRIDQLGRFETDIEPEPDKKSESRISRVVKKLVNKDEGKAQEEMAWQVAEMIVRNITNVTMGGGDSPSDDDTNT